MLCQWIISIQRFMMKATESFVIIYLSRHTQKFQLKPAANIQLIAIMDDLHIGAIQRDES